MHQSAKPVRKCHPCLLNMGSYCWLYQYPRGQWRDGKRCRGIENEDLHRQFEHWRKEPDVKTRHELRREFFRGRKRANVHHDPVGHRKP